MCTVTYIPQKEGYILTSNRDESALRSPKNITQLTRSGQELLFPRDKGAGGSWIMASSKDRLVCLLNGAFERQERQLPYRISRGIMVMDFFDSPHANLFFEQYNFKGIEPFTLITYDNGQLFDFRWDGVQTHLLELDISKPHIWSSATLYDEGMQQKRKEWFAEWLNGRTDFSRMAILALHKEGGEGNPSIDFMMNRYNYLVQTVSITQVVSTNTIRQMFYHDLITNTQVKKSLSHT